MKVLIVVFPKTDRRAEQLAQLVSEARSGTTTIIDDRANVLGQGISALVQNTGPHELIIHHCGSSNGEYETFVKNYGYLCRDKGWEKPPIILFSGSASSIESADRIFASDQLVCVIPQTTLERNLISFIQAAYQTPNKIVPIDEIPWGILRGFGEREYPLQLLSALLPFGVMWEFSGEAGSRKGLKIASEKLSIDLFRETERIIAERVKALSAIEPKDYQTSIPGNANHATVFIDRLMHKKLKTSTNAKELENLASAVCGRRDLNLDSALQVLTSSTSLRNWNRRLSLLRNYLLD